MHELITTNEDQVIQLSQPDISVASFQHNNYTIQGYTMQRLPNKVTQLSSNHLANKKVHYLQTAESQDNILPRGGLWN